mgnify:CR=1 FL=1
MLGGIIVNRYCKYHPGTQALWYCSHDGLHLCQQCVDGRNDSLIEARCLLCNQELESSEQGQGGPLWRQLDRYLRYPFTPVLLPLLVVWALLASLVPPLPVMVPVVVLAGLPAWGFARAVMALRSHPGKARKSHTPGWDCLSDMAGWKAALLQALPALLVMVPAGFVLVMVSVPSGPTTRSTRSASSDIAPMANPHDAMQRLRPDAVTETDQRERFQAIAPQTEDGLYLVPKVID